MTEILVTAGGQAPRRVTLKGDCLRLGRSPDCEIVIDDPGLSRVHAQLVREGTGWVIQDLESRNGTFVNDAPVTRQRLAPGDRVRLGQEVELELAPDGRGAPRGAPERARRSARPRGPRGGGRVWPGAALLRRIRFALAPCDARAGGAEVPLRGRAITVGRDPAAPVRLEHESISRLHARLEREGSGFVVTDLKSSNGTRVNGETVRQARLEPGGLVQFGDLSFELVRREGLAVGRLVMLAAVIAGVALAGWGVDALDDWWKVRQAAQETARHYYTEALVWVEKGIAAWHEGDADFARSYLVFGGNLLILSGRAPASASLDRPAELFRVVARDLPPGERNFDFAEVFDPRTLARAEQRLETLPNHDYVAHMVKDIAIGLGQDEGVPQSFTDSVWSFVEDCTTHHGWFQIILDRSPRYQPMLLTRMKEAGLPPVFTYIAWIESGLDPGIHSDAGAGGLWQLMPFKARELGLRVDGTVDERLDPEKATRAALVEIGNLVKVFGREQFMCALAAYNRGPGGVQSAMKRIPDPMMPSSLKFWYIVEHHLWRDTRGETGWYVPRFFAANIMAGAPGRFGFRPPGEGR